MSNLAAAAYAGVAQAAPELGFGRRPFLSTLPAGPVKRRLALAVVLASVVIFLAAAPHAKTPPPQVWAFLPIYQSALVVNDLITAPVVYPAIAELVRQAGFYWLAITRTPSAGP